jgi:hypothetical protein
LRQSAASRLDAIEAAWEAIDALVTGPSPATQPGRDDAGAGATRVPSPVRADNADPG